MLATTSRMTAQAARALCKRLLSRGRVVFRLGQMGEDIGSVAFIGGLREGARVATKAKFRQI